MDPLAHTLFGATLAESGLKRRSRYAAATLLIGANLPDVDAVAGLWGEDVELHVRRGITHGILALLILPLLLTAGVFLWQRWRRDAARDGSPPFRLRAILALSFIGVWSHPLLDWLNTYGVRLLMPFDPRWFYGDTLFIVDPWFWLLTAAGVVLCRSRSWRAIAGWTLLAVLGTALIASTSLVPLAVKLTWWGGVAFIAWLRWRQPQAITATAVARTGFATLLIYIGSAYGLARLAESGVASRFPDAQQVQANPAPGTPFSHRVVVMEPDRYRIVTADGHVHDLPRQPPDRIVQQALASPSIRGFANWTRFPHWTVVQEDAHWLVRFQDLRYQGPDIPDAQGIGVAEVRIPME